MSEKQQFSALEILDFLNKFTALYQKYYNETLQLTINKDSDGRNGEGLIMVKSSGPGELHVDRSYSQSHSWTVWLDVHLIKDVRAKPEIMRLCQSLIPAETANMLPPPDASKKFAMNNLIDVLEKELPDANIKRHDPHHTDGLTYVDIRMNGKLVVVMHSIIHGFGISHINSDAFDLSNAADELCQTVAGTVDRVKQLLKPQEETDGS